MDLAERLATAAATKPHFNAPDFAYPERMFKKIDKEFKLTETLMAKKEIPVIVDGAERFVKQLKVAAFSVRGDKTARVVAAFAEEAQHLTERHLDRVQLGLSCTCIRRAARVSAAARA